MVNVKKKTATIRQTSLEPGTAPVCDAIRRGSVCSLWPQLPHHVTSGQRFHHFRTTPAPLPCPRPRSAPLLSQPTGDLPRAPCRLAWGQSGDRRRLRLATDIYRSRPQDCRGAERTAERRTAWQFANWSIALRQRTVVSGMARGDGFGPGAEPLRS